MSLSVLMYLNHLWRDQHYIRAVPELVMGEDGRQQFFLTGGWVWQSLYKEVIVIFLWVVGSVKKCLPPSASD